MTNAMNTDTITITLPTGESVTYSIMRPNDATMIGPQTLIATVQALTQGLQSAVGAKPRTEN